MTARCDLGCLDGLDLVEDRGVLDAFATDPGLDGGLGAADQCLESGDPLLGVGGPLLGRDDLGVGVRHGHTGLLHLEDLVAHVEHDLPVEDPDGEDLPQGCLGGGEVRQVLPGRLGDEVDLGGVGAGVGDAVGDDVVGGVDQRLQLGDLLGRRAALVLHLAEEVGDHGAGVDVVLLLSCGEFVAGIREDFQNSGHAVLLVGFGMGRTGPVSDSRGGKPLFSDEIRHTTVNNFTAECLIPI